MVHVKKCFIQLFVIVFVLIATILLNYVTKLLMFNLKIINEDLINPQIVVEAGIVAWPHFWKTVLHSQKNKKNTGGPRLVRIHLVRSPV